MQNRDMEMATLRLWREISRIRDYPEAANKLFTMLNEFSSIDKINFYKIEPDTGLVSLCAACGKDKFPAGTLSMKTDELKNLYFNLRKNKEPVFRDSEEIFKDLIPGKNSDREWMALTLFQTDGHLDLVLLHPAEAYTFSEKDFELFKSLLEPLAAITESIRRLKIMQTLTEAAEADKISALKKLGRSELTDTVIGINGGLASVMDNVEKVADSDMPVLLLGETGTGKELIARAIHRRSKRASGPFIRVNCGAIATELVDSQLFGHERGAFTGAVSSMRGWFERADNGTLLLDEIAELPHPAQVRLLRVLQEGVFERVGGENPVRVNVRVVAATHRDLKSRVNKEKFREDLWYRISGFPIFLPPLRERREDIPDLVAYLAKRAANRFGLRECHPSPSDLDMLINYPWPGNIREMASVIDRASILGNGRRLAVPESLGYSPEHKKIAFNDGNEVADNFGIPTLDEAMKEHIKKALAFTGGRIEGKGGCAKILDINPHTLRARMRKLGINRDSYRSPEKGD